MTTVAGSTGMLLVDRARICYWQKKLVVINPRLDHLVLKRGSSVVTGAMKFAFSPLEKNKFTCESRVDLLSTKAFGFSNLNQVLRKRGSFVLGASAADAADGEVEPSMGSVMN